MANARRKEDKTLAFEAGPAETTVSVGAKPAAHAVPMRRVSFNLPEPLFEDIQQFAAERGETMTGVLRWSLGLGKAIWNEVKAGNRVHVVSDDQEVVKELVLRPY